MKRFERVRAALRGEAVDRPPYGFWTHMPGLDLDPLRLAEETAAFHVRYDMDFVKSMPNGFYCVEDWGCVVDYSDIERGGTARVTQPAVSRIADWQTIVRLPVTRGTFARELDHLAALTRKLGDEVPVLATVFSPLTIAAKLSNGAVRDHLRQDRERVEPALSAIAETTCDFAAAAMQRGCAGVFLAIQEAAHGIFQEEAYREYGEPYDVRVLEAAAQTGAWFNTVHLHGENVMFDLVSAYPAHALNWHIGETEPTLGEYRAAGGTRAVLGGLQRGHITQRNLPAVRRDIERAMAESGGPGLLLAPACVIRHPVDHAVLAATAEMIKRLQRN
jgi:uroporphyrinogen decarboxylase